MQISRLSIILAVVSTSLGNDCTEDDPCYTCTGINQDLGPDGKFPDGACVGTGHVAGLDDSRIQPCDWQHPCNLEPFPHACTPDWNGGGLAWC
ncbi:unnamed protein product [Zymoseptoria tritici ST99CH_1E4]|uniref:CBM1 domain-containing protein n=1 Tax=Zymoseptoria tritici ST99CH_1E4 TaxID=1276532 RepID=A0A2H1GB36_ZYMTR|nr:unnamed protein product [Zymoseptoria tritici ST99CH_1E4]